MMVQSLLLLGQPATSTVDCKGLFLCLHPAELSAVRDQFLLTGFEQIRVTALTGISKPVAADTLAVCPLS